MTSLVSVAASGFARRLSMLGRALDTLRRLLAKPEPTAHDLALARLAVARKRRWQASEDYADSLRRGDTRDQHHFLLLFKRARMAELAAEMEARV